MIRCAFLGIALALLNNEALSAQRTWRFTNVVANPEAIVEVGLDEVSIRFSDPALRFGKGLFAQRFFAVSTTITAVDTSRPELSQIVGGWVRKDTETRVVLRGILNGTPIEQVYPYGESADELITLSAPVQWPLTRGEYRASVSVSVERRRTDADAEIRIATFQIGTEEECPLCSVLPQFAQPLFAFSVDMQAVSTLMQQAMFAPLVIGGKNVSGQFPDVVAIKTGKGYCTGILIDPQLVLTAEHCKINIGFPVFYGDSAESPFAYRSTVMDLLKPAIINGSSTQLGASAKDRPLVLVLKDSTPDFRPPRDIASASKVAPEPSGRVVGYGFSNSSESKGLGSKRYADIDIQSVSCSGTLPNGKKPANYGCVAELEMIAGGNGKDTCQGDSGGPLLVPGSGKNWLIAAITSRGTQAEGCGAGGIYILMYHWTKWIKDLQFAY